MISKERLVFDPAAADESDNLGVYLRSADGTLLTHTTIGAKEALDVNVENTVTVEATDLDIRDLAFATDSVDVSGSSVSISGDVNVTQGTDPWVVSATDLDIRDLDASQDNVAIDGISAGGNALVINADGSINVNADIDIVNGAEKAEDSAHASGDIGQYVLAVREDVLASSTSADGDYASFKVNDVGALWVELADKTLNVLPPSHTGWLVSQNTINDTAELIVAADLTNRRKILIQNVSGAARTIHLGHSNAVTDANGIRLSAGAATELELAAGVDIYAIGPAAGADIRIAEFAAA
jgi:hypothetical protein